MKPKAFLIILNVLASFSCIIFLFKFVLYPEYMKIAYSEEYKHKMFACDNVMREHLLAKHRVIANPNDGTVKALDAAEVSLLTCHEYDKLRKKLIAAGVTEIELAYIGLEKIEEHSADIYEVVETHEFRY